MLNACFSFCLYSKVFVNMGENLILQGLSEDIVKLFLERLGDRLLSIVFFGSQVSGRAFGDSDVDVLVVTENDVSYPLLENVCHGVNIELTLKYINKVNSIPFHKGDVLYMLRKKHPFIFGFFHTSLVAYDPRGFFGEVLNKIGKGVAEGEVRIYERSGLVIVK